MKKKFLLILCLLINNFSIIKSQMNGKECNTDLDCHSSNQFCLKDQSGKGTCVKKCKNHFQCPPKYYCDIETNTNTQQCFPINPAEIGHECLTDNDCPGFERCIIMYGDGLNFCSGD